MSFLLSGCNSSKADPELEALIGGLPAAQVSDGKLSYTPPVSEEEDNTQYSSLTGKIISVSAKEITVKCNDKEYIFTVDNATKIFGGKTEVSIDVTVTYDGDLSEKKTAALIVTVLNGSDLDNTSAASEEPPVTTIAETTAESAETAAKQTTAAEETTAETVTETAAAQSETTAEETTAAETVTEGETEALPPEETTA